MWYQRSTLRGKALEAPHSYFALLGNYQRFLSIARQLECEPKAKDCETDILARLTVTCR